MISLNLMGFFSWRMNIGGSRKLAEHSLKIWATVLVEAQASRTNNTDGA
jgi:hypothetical protein